MTGYVVAIVYLFRCLHDVAANLKEIRQTMRTLKPGLLVIAFFVGFMMSSGIAHANGVAKYAAHEFDKAIESSKDGKDLTSKLILALAYTEKASIYKNSADKEQAKMYIKLLEVDLTIKDAKAVEEFLNVEGNPNGNEVAAKLLKKCFQNAECTPGDIMVVASFVNPAKGAAASELSLSTISKLLGNVRDYVSKGATMPKEMQALFANHALITPMIDALDDKKTASAARKCLVLLEEPTLTLLEAKELTPAIGDAIVDVKKAIAKRKTKYPNSTWFSASGK